jgi:hypothetical protein
MSKTSLITSKLTGAAALGLESQTEEKRRKSGRTDWIQVELKEPTALKYKYYKKDQDPISPNFPKFANKTAIIHSICSVFHSQLALPIIKLSQHQPQYSVSPY